MNLIARIENAQKLLREGRLANEAAVSSGVVLPLLDALGWPVFDPAVVAPEYGLGGRRVDFALLGHGRPAVFVEVKQPGQSNGADRQLFEYAFHVGVPMAVLTDGATWHVYLPAEQGSYQERRVYLLDLLEREPADSAERLIRYLGHGAVVSGEAIERARHDYQHARQRREAKEALPRAWGQLVGQGDDRLMDLLSQEVESLSGYKPASEDVQSYLASLGGQTEREAAASASSRPSRPTRVAETAQTARPAILDAPPSDTVLPSVGFTLNGAFVPGRSGADVLRRTFQALADRDPTFLDRFIELPQHGEVRRYLARRPEDLYPGRPELVKKAAFEIRPGYWIGTHYSLKGLRRILQLASQVAGLRFNEHLKVRLG